MLKKSTAVQFAEIFHFLDELRIWLVVPLLQLDSFLHFFKGFSEHSGELNGHVFHFLFQVSELLFLLSKFVFVFQLAWSQLLFASFYDNIWSYWCQSNVQRVTYVFIQPFSSVILLCFRTVMSFCLWGNEGNLRYQEEFVFALFELLVELYDFFTHQFLLCLWTVGSLLLPYDLKLQGFDFVLQELSLLCVIFSAGVLCKNKKYLLSSLGPCFISDFTILWSSFKIIIIFTFKIDF